MRTLILITLAAAASAADTDTGFVTELTIGLGGSVHQKTALADHHGQADLSISAAVVRERDRESPTRGVMGGVVGYRWTSDLTRDDWSRTEEVYLGPALHLYGNQQHEVRLGFGPDVITAERKHGGFYVTETAIGGWIEAQYYFRYRASSERRGSSAIGAAIGAEGADVGYAGSRVPAGGYHLSLLLSRDF
jgi:hypothetical protein